MSGRLAVGTFSFHDVSFIHEQNEKMEEYNALDCVICCDKLAEVSIVHGNTAHKACCNECAIKLIDVSHVCPVCR